MDCLNAANVMVNSAIPELVEYLVSLCAAYSPALHQKLARASPARGKVGGGAFARAKYHGAAALRAAQTLQRRGLVHPHTAGKRRKKSFTFEDVKSSFDEFGVNLLFLGEVTKALEARLRELLESDVDAREKAHLKGRTTSTTTSNRSRKPSDASVNADNNVVPAFHDIVVVKMLRMEMVARATRTVLNDEWRDLVAHLPSTVHTPQDVHEVMCERALEFLLRLSGDGLSYLDDSDKRMWNAKILPRIKEMFGYDMSFFRECGTLDLAAKKSSALRDADSLCLPTRVFACVVAARIRTGEEDAFAAARSPFRQLHRPAGGLAAKVKRR